MITIVDYGAGNLRSVQKAFEYIGCDAVVTGDGAAIRSAERVVLPGVGAFGDAMRNLAQRGLDDVVRGVIADGTPFLGICLGMQLMYEHSEEGGCAGLGILPGRVVRFPADMGLKVPQIGWNSLHICRPSRLLDGVPDGAYVYLVHSYYVQAAEQADVAAVTQYGVQPHVAVEHENILLTQFHPEKSGDVGLHILNNFAQVR